MTILGRRVGIEDQAVVGQGQAPMKRKARPMIEQDGTRTAKEISRPGRPLTEFGRAVTENGVTGSAMPMNSTTAFHPGKFRPRKFPARPYLP